MSWFSVNKSYGRIHSPFFNLYAIDLWNVKHLLNRFSQHFKGFWQTSENTNRWTRDGIGTTPRSNQHKFFPQVLNYISAGTYG
jgi:hypothetical protein